MQRLYAFVHVVRVCVCKQKRTFYIFRAFSGYMAALSQTRMKLSEKDVLDIDSKK